MPGKIILGIDPGSRKLGYGIIISENQKLKYISSGVIAIPLENLATRLGFIFHKISEIITEHKPHNFAIEEVFVNKNISGALKLGQARGSAIVAAVTNNITVFEYSARLIKQSVTGTGAADKHQVQQMVRILLNLSYLPKPDEADALAIAICHANSSSSSILNQAMSSVRF